MRTSSKLILIVSAVAATLLVLTACGGGSSNTERPRPGSNSLYRCVKSNEGTVKVVESYENVDGYTFDHVWQVPHASEPFSIYVAAHVTGEGIDPEHSVAIWGGLYDLKGGLASSDLVPINDVAVRYSGGQLPEDLDYWSQYENYVVVRACVEDDANLFGTKAQ